MKMVVEKLGEAGQVIERANCLSGQFHDAYLGGPNAEQETRNACINAELCAEFDIPVLGVQPYAAGLSNPNLPSINEYVEGRGGYKHAKFELAEALSTPRAADAPDEEDLWARHVKHYTAICEVAEPAGVKVATHGNDPPVPMLHGYPGILNSFETFDRLFSEVPSPANGITFCVGTRYESGQNIFEGIKHFGEQNRLFHVHFRNVVGRIPENKGYMEVIPDSGDLNMYEVAKAPIRRQLRRLHRLRPHHATDHRWSRGARIHRLLRRAHAGDYSVVGGGPQDGLIRTQAKKRREPLAF